MHTSEGILIVEDDTNWQDTLSRLLKGEGYEIEFATEYSRALDKILRAGAWFTVFDLALCIVDLRLAGSTVGENYDGLGLLAVCKIRGIPAIVVSAYLTRRLKDQLRDQYGVMTAFDKYPFPEQEFLAVVRRAVASYAHVPDRFPLRMHEMAEVEFRTKLENLVDTINDSYKRAHAIINEKQRERRIARGRSSAEDEALWRQQLSELDQKFNTAIERLSQANTIAELDRLHPEIVEQSLRWMSG